MEVVRIGHAAPLTGGIAHLGKDNENGARLAVEEINARGGIELTGRRVRLQLIAVDDEADPFTGALVAQQLLEKQVVAVVGHLNSGTSIPASKIYYDGRVAQISPSATNPKFTQQGFDTAFRVVANDEAQARALAEYAQRSLGVRRVAIVSDRTAYGNGLADLFKATLRDMGIDTLAHEYVTDQQLYFASVVRSIVATDPDLLFFGGMDAVAGPLLRELRTAGWRGVFLSGDGACSPEFIKLAGRAGEGTHCSMAGEAVEKLPRGSEFLDKYKRRFGGDVQVYSPYSYDAVYVLAEAIKRAGTTERNAIVRAVRETNYRGVTGPIRFDPKGDLVKPAVSFFRVKNGRLEYVTVMRPN